MEHEAHRPEARKPGDGSRPSRARLSCLLATLNPDRGLSIALRQHLRDVLPDIEFTLESREESDAIWVCGFEPGRGRLVRALRQRHPEAILVVTGRDPVEDWEPEVAAAGADFAFSWPVAYEVLRTVLAGGLPSKSLQNPRRSLAPGQ